MGELAFAGLIATIVGLVGLQISDSETDHALGVAIGVAAIALILLAATGFRLPI